MKTFTKVVAFLLIVTCFNQVTSAAPDTVSKIFLDITYWKRMMWQKADTSELWRAAEWLPFEGGQAKDSTITKTRSLVLFGKEFHARLGYNNDKIENKFFVSLYAKASRNDCNAILKQLTSIFGQPIMNDGTYFPLFNSEKNYVKLVRLDYQWDTGDTRINGGCFGSVSPDTESQMDTAEFFWSMKYAHQSAIPKLVPKFALRCTRKFEWTNHPGSFRELDDLVVWIDTNSKHVTNAKRISIEDLNTFQATDSVIEFKITRDKTVSAYTLNRITGSLTGILNQDNRIMARISGKCEKTDTIKRNSDPQQ